MVQGLQPVAAEAEVWAGGRAEAEVWVEAKAAVEWAAHLRQGQVEVVYAPTAATKKRI